MDRIRVFITDDNRAIRDLAKRCLDDEPDIEIVGEAASGEETLRIIRVAEVDVLVTDLRMGRLNGIEVARRLTKTTPGFNVLIWSVSTDFSNVLQACKSGARGFVSKDGGVNVLLDAIRRVSDKEFTDFYYSPDLKADTEG